MTIGRALLLVLSAFLAAPAAPDGLRAQEGQKSAKKKAGRKDAGEPSGGSISLSSRDKEKARNKLRRQAQTGKTDFLAKTVEEALQKAHPETDRDLIAVAMFYKACLRAKELDEAGFWEYAEKSIEHGNLNADGFQNSSLIPDPIKASDRFRERMEKLRAEAETLVRKQFETDVRTALKNPGEAFPLPGEGGVGPLPLAAGSLEGKPALLVITPIGHDGFDKTVPHLQSVQKSHGDRVGIAVLFVQYDPGDAVRRSQTEEYMKKLGLGVPAAVVGREYARPLAIPYFPAYVFLNAEGKQLFRHLSYLEPEKLLFVVDELARAAPAARPAPEAGAPSSKDEAKPPATPKEPTPTKDGAEEAPKGEEAEKTSKKES